MAGSFAKKFVTINDVHVHNGHENVTSQKHNFLQLCSSHEHTETISLRYVQWALSRFSYVDFLHTHGKRDRVSFSLGGQHKMLDIKSGHQHTNCSKRKLKSARISTILYYHYIDIYIYDMFFCQTRTKKLSTVCGFLASRLPGCRWGLPHLEPAWSIARHPARFNAALCPTNE